MENVRELIIKLKAVKEEKGLSLNKIAELVEKNGDFISRSSIQRVFADGSEDTSFRYEDTLRPIAKALLDIETIEETDNLDVQAMKVLLKFKIDKINELEAQLDKEKIKYHEKLEKERELHKRSIEFLKEQVNLKDKRMDLLLDSVAQKDIRLNELIEHIMNCPYRKETICGEQAKD